MARLAALVAGLLWIAPLTTAAKGPARPVAAATASAAGQGEGLERLFLNELRAKLLADDFFKDTRIHVVDDASPLALLSENPPSQKNRTFYLPWLHKLSGNLKEGFLRPLGTTRRAAYAVTPVIVLANDTSFAKYWKARRGTEEVVAPSTFDPTLRAVVTSETGNAAWLRRQPVLRDLALATLIAHSAEGAESDEPWFRRGFACYVSYHTGTRTEALDSFKPNRYAVRFLFDLLRQKSRREALWMSLEDLMAVESPEALSTKPRGEEPSARQVFDDTASIWLHFFQHAEEGKYREGAGAYLGRVLAGDGGPRAFEECFGTGDLAALEREFEGYVLGLFDAIFVAPTRKPDPEAEALATEVVPPLDLSPLQARPADLAEGLGMALWGAQHGRLSEAITLLEELGSGVSVSETDGADDERLERELLRLRTLREARDRFFSRAVEQGDKVRLVWRDEKVHDVPTGFEDGLLSFVKEESSRTIPIDEIDSATLALCMGAAPDDLGAGWLRSYAFALAEDTRWKRFLRDRGPLGKQLAEDAETHYPVWLEAGRTLGALADLAAGGEPETPEQATACLERIVELLESAGPAAPPGRRERILAQRPLFTELARRSLRLRYLDDGVQEALKGEVEALPGGRMRVTYDFSEAEQFEDFEEVSGYLKWRRDQMRVTPPAKDFKVQKGTLRGSGAHCFRHRLKFGAPMSLDYEFEFDKKRSSETDLAEVLVAICDDREGSYLGCYAQGELHIEQKRLRAVDIIGRGEEPGSYLVGHPHVMGLRHDGEVVSTWRLGEKRQESPCLGLTSGYVFLWVALTGTLWFDNIVIEGAPDPVGLRALRDAWVAEQLEALGLAPEADSE